MTICNIIIFIINDAYCYVEEECRYYYLYYYYLKEEECHFYYFVSLNYFLVIESLSLLNPVRAHLPGLTLKRQVKRTGSQLKEYICLQIKCFGKVTQIKH